jgi:hypothetical protein
VVVEVEAPEAMACATASEHVEATLQGRQGAQEALCREATGALEATVDTAVPRGMEVCSTFDVRERFEVQMARSTFAAATERQVPSDQIPPREEEEVVVAVAVDLLGTTAAA